MEAAVNIHFETRPDHIYYIQPTGRLDAVNVPALEAVFDAHLTAQQWRIVLDLTGVTYLSSSGLRVLLRARKQAQAGGGDVVLCGLTPRVGDVFEIIGFTGLFQVFDQAADATASFTQKPAPPL